MSPQGRRGRPSLVPGREQGDNFAVGPMQSIETSSKYVKKYLE